MVCIGAVTFLGTGGSAKVHEAGDGLSNNSSGATTSTTHPLPPEAYSDRTSCLAAGHIWIRGACYPNG
ncbi:hypothetical protein ACE2AJ_03560 [Aquihabitans daechungensis]|uniref:hypothetical protein n=1 Tax=Aquihabitans daechungensis TaxID=1052257 RepID=UPI003B9F9CC9